MSETLKQASGQAGTSLVVLGRPAATETTFKLADSKAPAAEIETETSIETHIVELE